MQNISFEGLTWIVKTLERVLMSAASKNFSEARPVPCAKNFSTKQPGTSIQTGSESINEK
jgi:hypothetical protein